MEEGGSGRPRWGTAVALAIAVLFLSVVDTLPLVLLPLGITLMALPLPRRGLWVAVGAALCWLGAVSPVGALGELSRAWALLLGGGFLLSTILRPRWPVLSRSLLGLGVALGAGALLLLVSGGWREVDALIRSHLINVSTQAFGALAAQQGESTWMEQFAASARQMALMQWRLFPGLLALQSLAALGLVSWVAARLRRAGEGPYALRPLREFRFNDQLVWVLIVGLVLLVLPLGAAATRLAYNALFFMGGLYALRGLGVFLFLGGSAPSLFLILFGMLATIFLYPLVLTATVLVGLGDTWLDVRGRAALAPRA